VLPNRIAKSAMSEGLASPDDAAPNERHARLYARWGRSGAGLLVTGNVMVAAGGRGEVGNVVVRDDRHLDALARWAGAAQAHGAQLWMQINHAGRQSPRTFNAHPVAPSAVPMRGMGAAFAPPRALEASEIEALVRAFARAAAVAKRAGFAGVQIHGAHGYLVSQFLSPLTNLRDDAWGGDAQRRMRFLLEVVRATRDAVGPAFPVGVKLNSADFQRGGTTPEDAALVVRALEAAGVDLLEVSGGSYEAPAMTGNRRPAAPPRASTLAREAYFLDAARTFRAASRVPLMLTGGMRSAAAMTEAVASGAVDVVGLARPMAYAPELPARLLADAHAAAAPVDLRTGLRRVDDLLEVFWYQAQLHRMARGNDPDPKLSRLRALVHGVRMSWTPRAAPSLDGQAPRALVA
jgi:2,4-dienoyl-CoA reductase-like NADH-dependent reductase (Old Yellow Enzyme family)